MQSYSVSPLRCRRRRQRRAFVTHDPGVPTDRLHGPGLGTESMQQEAAEVTALGEGQFEGVKADLPMSAGTALWNSLLKQLPYSGKIFGRRALLEISVADFGWLHSQASFSNYPP